MCKKLIIIGASGHGKVLADIAKKNGYTQIAFLDDDPKATECNGYPVKGASGDFSAFSDHDFIVGIGNAAVRRRIQEQLSAAGLNIVSLIHPSAVIGENVFIGPGTAVMAGAVINPCTTIGTGCIINTCASVDHDCQIGDFAHISVGAHIAGTVEVGESTWVAAGATVINNLHITNDCMIGAGAVVVKDISEPGTYVGVPAKRMK